MLICKKSIVTLIFWANVQSLLKSIGHHMCEPQGHNQCNIHKMNDVFARQDPATSGQKCTCTKLG